MGLLLIRLFTWDVGEVFNSGTMTIYATSFLALFFSSCSIVLPPAAFSGAGLPFSMAPDRDRTALVEFFYSDLSYYCIYKYRNKLLN